MNDAQWEKQAQDFIAKHWPQPLNALQPRAYHLAAAKWYTALAESGWSVPHWAQRFGGSNWSKQRLYRWQMLCQQVQSPPIDTLAMSTVAPLLMAFGTQNQQALLLGEVAGLQNHWCLGLLEPVQCREVTRLAQGDGGLRLTGEKRALADGLLMSTDLPKNSLWPRHVLCLVMHEDQWVACLLPSDRPGLELNPVANTRGRWFHLSFDGVLVQVDEILPLKGDALLLALANPSDCGQPSLPNANSLGLAEQLRLLGEDLRAQTHEDSETLITQLHEAEVALQGLRALELRALAPISPQFPKPLPMQVLNVKSQQLAEEIGALQLASFGYYSLPKVDDLRDHNEGPLSGMPDSAKNTAGDISAQVGQAMLALAASDYGWNAKDVLARHWLGLNDRRAESDQDLR